MRLVNLTGQRFGRLVVLRRGEDISNRVAWLCECDCGKKTNVVAHRLHAGGCVSCGCFRIDHSREMATKHGHNSRGARTPIYAVWRNMISRCTYPNTPAFKDYGGRGITVCDRWRDSFENFLADVGEPPTRHHMIERLNNDGNYEPMNCVWATRKEQARNTRRNRLLTYAGETMCVSAWSERVGISANRIINRLREGWSVARSLTTPARKIRRRMR